VSSATEITGADGRASVTVTAGSEAGTIEVEASVAGVTPVVFTLTVVHQVIPAPASTPNGITWDGSSLWVVAGLLDTPEIYQIDPADGTVLQSFPAPAGRHRGLAWDGSHLWYSSHETARIYRLDPADNGNVVLEFASPGSRPRGLTWDGTHLWHNDAAVSSPVVYRLDPTNGDVLDSVASPVSDPLGLAWDGSHLWTAQFAGDRSIVRFDPDTGSVVATIPNPGDLPLGLTVDPAGPWLWVSDGNAGMIYRLSLDP
jgi:DNA-binding beta-propeller fold protein YncE